MAKEPIKLSKSIRFLCDLWLAGAALGAAGYAIWIVWLLVAPILGGSAQAAAQWAAFPVAVDLEAGRMPGPAGLPEKAILSTYSRAAVLSPPGIATPVGNIMLQFLTSDRRIQALSCLDQFIVLLLLLGLLYMVRQFLVDVIDGRPFSFDNARRLKWIGWLLLAVGLARPLADYLAARWTFAMLKIQSAMLWPAFNISFGFILVALFVLILAAAFRRGVELEKERSLTV